MFEFEISVIVPVYNVEKYLDKCVRSLLNQKFAYNYEIILVNDGSTDSSGNIADKYAMEHSMLKVLHKKNGGLSSARNYGLRYARGKYITFVDSDDYVSDDYLSALHSMAMKYDADIVLTQICLMTEDEAEKYHKEEIETELIDNKEAFWEVYIQKRVSWSACGKLIKKEILNKHKFPDGYYEDSASMYLFLDEAERVVVSDLRNNYHYIRREGSITASRLSEKHMRIFEVCDEIENYLKNNYIEWEYLSALIYQNAVLQLLTRINMGNDEYKNIFRKALKKSRKNIMKIISKKKLGIKTKYYAAVLCTSPTIFKLQRNLMIKMKIIKGDWV
nr:glycosyltransferase [uncultured Blautia sp.]